MDYFKNYIDLKSREEKRVFCFNLDVNKTYFKYLSYEKISEFTINVCFEKLTGIKVNQVRKARNIKYIEHKTY